MWKSFKCAAFVGFLALSGAMAEQPLKETAQFHWEHTIQVENPNILNSVNRGNGVKITPDGQRVIVTSAGGTVTALDAMTGAFEWSYQAVPSTVGALSCQSQVEFTTSFAAEPYMVFSVVEENDSRVIALDMDGTELWKSDPLVGTAVGTPVISSDGMYVYTNHNSEEGRAGWFSMLDASSQGTVHYQQSAFNLTQLNAGFAPIGIYHRPIEGHYDGDAGRGNRNDMLLFSMKPAVGEDPIEDGYMLGFQTPIGWTGGAADIALQVMGVIRGFKSDNAPTMHNNGLSAYFSTTRGGFWTFANPEIQGRFSRSPTNTAGFERFGPFKGHAVWAAPALSSSEENPSVFCGGANTHFIKMDTEGTEETAVIRTTDALIYSQAKVDPFDRVVYFVDVDGKVHQVDYNDLTDKWVYEVRKSEGEIALSDNGWLLYVADRFGVVTALQVSDIPETPSPTTSPTAMPTGSPTAPTSSPTSITEPPSAAPTGSSTSSPTEATDTPAPSSAPSSAPTEESAATKPMFLFSVVAMALGLLF